MELVIAVNVFGLVLWKALLRFDGFTTTSFIQLIAAIEG